MHKNSAYYNNQQISKVIELSINYKNHRKILKDIKPILGIPSLKQVKKTDHLTENKIKYAGQSRNLKYSQLRKQNQVLVKRIQKANSIYKKIVNPELNHSVSKDKLQKLNNSKLSKIKSKQRLRSSLKSSSSQTSILSNFRQRTKRYKQIKNQNKKIAERIQNPKVNKSMRIKQWDKAYEKQQEFMKIRSRFSERSRSIMQSLMLDGLKMDKKHLQFLPQINSPSSKKYQTLNVSRSRKSITEDESKRKIKTINIAKHINSARKSQNIY